MTRRRLVSLTTLMAFIAVVLLAPLSQAQAGHPEPGPGRDWSGIAKTAVKVAGAVVGGLFGAKFGMIGTVVGGVVGFLVTKWLADNFFPHYGALDFDRPQWFRGRGGWDAPPPYGQQPGYGQTPGWWGSGTYSGDLKDLRDRFYEATRKLQGALAGGSDADKQAAKSEYDQAREAYFRAKYGSGR